MLDSKSNHVIFLVTCDAAGVASDSPRLGSPLPAERPRDPANPGSLVGRVRAAGAGNEPSHMQSTAAETRQKRSWPGLRRMLPRLARHAMHAMLPVLVKWPAGRRRPSPTKRPSALGENLLGIRAPARKQSVSDLVVGPGIQEKLQLGEPPPRFAGQPPPRPSPRPPPNQREGEGESESERDTGSFLFGLSESRYQPVLMECASSPYVPCLC